MAKAAENPATEATYLEFFGLTRPPFARLPEPSSIYHAEQYSLLMSHLAQATSETDCLVVLRGVDGSGKTTLLNRFLSGLGEDATFASIDESCSDAVDFYSTFLQQIGFNEITGKSEELRRITREFLVHRAKSGDTVLLVIDNAQSIRPAVFEQMRWLTHLEVDGSRVLSIILAGNSDLRRVIESPAMQDIQFHSYVDFHIRAYTEEETADYIHYRLMLAGGEDKVTFARDSQPLIYRFTGGIPRNINRVCSSLLTEACARNTNTIDEDLVRAVAEAEQLPTNVFPLQGRGRRKTDPDFAPASSSEQEDEERIRVRDGSRPLPEKDTPARPDIDVDALLQQIAELSGKVEQLEADKANVEKDRDSQRLDITELRESLEAQSNEADKLAREAQERTDEAQARAEEADEHARDVDRLRKELEDTRKSLQRNADDAKKLAADLKEEKRAARTARTSAKRAKTRVEKLEEMKNKLQDSSKELRTDLRQAQSRVSELENVEQRLSESEAERENLETERENLELERERLEEAVAELDDLRQSITDKDALISDLKEDLARSSLQQTQTQTRLAEIPTGVHSTVAADAAEPGELKSRIFAFEVIRKGEVESVYVVENGQSRIMIGRGEDSDLRLTSEFVSRHHALVFLGPGENYIEDLNSFNGTVVNGKTVTRCDLRPNDVVVVGDFRIRPLANS